MEIQDYIDNLNSNDYIEYLEKYKKLIENNTKCIKSKKCNPKIMHKNNKLILDTGKNKKEELEIQLFKCI